jgi:diketogulonate reductase-like aldo/keto reductase
MIPEPSRNDEITPAGRNRSDPRFVCRGRPPLSFDLEHGEQEECAMQTVKLSSGYEMPVLGLGTWQLTGSTCEKAVADALQLGYTHVDTAFAYGNHKQVGKGIKDSGVDRGSIFLTTKIPLGKQTRSQILQQGGELLRELDTDYVDLLLLHWPTRDTPFEESLSALKELVDKDMVRSIGISNFNKDLVKQVAEISEIPVVTNQVEFHPYLYQKELKEVCEANDMVVTAYSPLARGEVLDDDRLRDIAEKHDTGIPQVVIQWMISKGIVVIPKASSKDHLESNMAALDLQLPTEDRETIDAFPEEKRMIDGGWKHYPF